MSKQFYYKKRVLITGGAGFIGKHLQKSLSAHGAIISVIDNSSEASDAAGGIKCDICDYKNLRNVTEDIDPEIVFHLAGLIDRTPEFSVIRKMIEVNIIGTLNLMESLRDSSCRAIIITGASEEYGNNKVPYVENFREDPVSPYSFSKVSISHMSKMLFNIYKLPITILRPTLAYGPGQPETMFIPALIKTLLRNESFKMSPGRQTRDFVYIDDLVQAYLKAGMMDKHSGEIFNIGEGNSYAIGEIAQRIAYILNKKSLLAVGAKDYRKSEIMSYGVNISKAESRLGWMPAVDIDDGLRRTVESYMDENKKQKK